MIMSNNPNIDIRLVIEQEPEFKEYLQKCIYNMFAERKDFTPILASLYGFYNIGLSIDDVTKWWRIQNSVTGNTGEPPDTEDVDAPA